MWKSVFLAFWLVACSQKSPSNKETYEMDRYIPVGYHLVRDEELRKITIGKSLRYDAINYSDDGIDFYEQGIALLRRENSPTRPYVLFSDHICIYHGNLSECYYFTKNNKEIYFARYPPYSKNEYRKLTISQIYK